MSSLHFGKRKGSSDGYKIGLEDGYHLGRCEAIKLRVPIVDGKHWDIKVLFISEFYENEKFHLPINQGIAAGLRSKVREVIVTRPDQNVVALAESTRPDLVLVLNGIFNFPVQQIDEIRAMGIRTALWSVEDPYFIDLTKVVAPHYDFVFTLETSCVSLYQALGCCQVHHLPAAVNEHLFYPRRIPNSHRRDICFIGTAFWNRVAYIDRMAKYLSSKKIIISGLLWDRLRKYSLLSDQIRLERCLSPDETANYYNGAKIVINLHRSHADRNHNMNTNEIPARSINPRTFEICACASLQLTDVRDELSKFYVPNVEIATYTSTRELMDKIEYYLTHDSEREEIALRGLEKTLREHTYPKRMELLLNTVFG